MASRPLKIAVLWHQHQPYYKLGNSYLLPWARLHATKDYYDLAATLDRFPHIKQTFNVVPSLLIQLIDYVENGATDTVLELSRRNASDLTEGEKKTILRYFFLCNAERMILPYERYRELYEQAEPGNPATTRQPLRDFTEQDWRDLQVWYNLTWIGEYSREEEPFASLLEKGSGYTESEKAALLNASLGIIAKIIPTYRRLMEEGQIELSVTPYYHPILPILCDSHTALEAMPNAQLPNETIMFPEDANEQIRRAVRLYTQQFGKEPVGMWPSEGSVSDEALELIRANNLQWVASDEGVLRKTLGENWNSLSRYFPYLLKTRSGPLWTFFRDHELSDAIGFVYSSWNPMDAALDFYNRLIELRARITREQGADALDKAVVPIILDGENCWEYYEQNGRPFLEELYRLLTESNEIETTTFNRLLNNRSPTAERTLGRIYAGSWIGSNFKIWIGHEEDNDAWDALAKARRTLMESREEMSDEDFAEAMEEIYIAEGSDWFWWFGDENSAANQDDFDELFRAHLRNVYRLIGKEHPAGLDRPIRRATHEPRIIPPRELISPTIDGLHSSEQEWLDAGHFLVEHVGGAMHRADAFERRIWFGHDNETFYIRFDTPLPLENNQRIRLSLRAQRKVCVEFSRQTVTIESTTDASGKVAVAGISAAVNEIMEAAIPLHHLDGDTKVPDAIGLVCEIFEQGHETERFPHLGEITCPLTLRHS